MTGISSGSDDALDAARLTRVIALDGPAGSGKSTVARRAAAVLGWRFVDTGAGYRAAALAALRAGVDLTDQDAVVAVVSRSTITLGTSATDPCVTLDGEDVSTEIRSPEVTAAVSAVSAVPAVRTQLVRLQRRAMATGGTGGVVVEGRDIATVVAPHAGVKVFLDAPAEVRAARRAAESPEAPEASEDPVSTLTSRDARDHQTTPLVASEGAVYLETSGRSVDEVVAAVVHLAVDAGLIARAPEPSPPPAGPGAAAPTASRPASAQHWVHASGRRKPWLVAASRPFGQALFHSLFRVQVVGGQHVPPQGPVLIAGNHTGFLDGPLAYALSPRPATFLAKSELFVGPLARALGWLGQIPVHRGRPDRRALRTGLAVLQGGGALGVFPEGTRGAGTLDTVSDGAAYLALRSGAPVVPLAILGTSQALPKGAKLPRWRAPLTLVFGPPFAVQVEGDPRTRRTVRAAGEQIRLELLAHLRSAQAEGHQSESTSRYNADNSDRDDLEQRA